MSREHDQTALKPCPFCGEGAERVAGQRTCNVRCINVCADMAGCCDDFPDADVTAIVWNERPIEDALVKALEGLLAIVSDSRGVDGFHLNGDVADWGEFEEVEQAYDALAHARGETPDER